MSKLFTAVRESLNEAVKYSDIRKWVFDKIENTEMDSDEMKKAFAKKFGKQNADQLEKAVSEFLGESVQVNEATYNEVEEWVFDKLENTEMDSDEMEAEVVKKFGNSAKAHYEKALSAYMD